MINEIMYDLPGSDTGREWIEIYNSGPESIDLSKFFIREAETNHKLDITTGSTVIPQGGFAVIADTPSKFLIDNPQFTGVLFGSSFSLSNTGESLVLKNGDIEVDTISYVSTLGGVGDGNTLARSGNTFVSSSPTPGKINTRGSHTEPVDTSTTSASTSPSLGTSEVPQNPLVNSATVSYWKTEPQIFPDAGLDRTVLLGSEIVFTGSALGIKKEPLAGARFLWNFGDGEVKEGRVVSHTFHYGGDYIVTLDVSSGEYSQGDRVSVKVIPPTVVLGSFSEGEAGYSEIKNTGLSELDISLFKLKTDSQTFIIPKGTLLRAQGVIKISNAVSALRVGKPKLLFPNGVEVKGEEVLQILALKPLVGQKGSTYTPRASLPVSQVASVGTKSAKVDRDTGVQSTQPTETKNDSSNSAFVLGLLALCGVIAGGIILVRRMGHPADEYTLVE